MKNAFIKPIFALLIFNIALLTYGQVVINEVMTRPDDVAPCPNNPTTNSPTCQGMIGAGREYVELYNPTCSEIDLSGYILASRSIVVGNDYGGALRLPVNTTIPPNGYITIGSGDPGAPTVDFSTLTADPNDVSIPTSRWLFPNSEGWVGLYDPSGTCVDLLWWASGSETDAISNGSSEFQDAPPVPTNSGAITLLSANDIFDATPGVCSYATYPSQGQVIARIDDGGTWQTNQTSSFGACNGTCNVFSTAFSVSTVVSQPTCADGDGSITLTPNPAGSYTYTWTPNVSSTNIATNLSTGTAYNVVVSDGSACDWDTTITLSTVSAIPQPSFTIVPESCDGLNDGSITVDNVTGGTAPYTYLWHDGSNGTSVTSLNPDSTFTLTITDSDPSNCPWDSTFNIAAGPICCLIPFSVDTINVAQNLTCPTGGGACSGTATAVPTAGVGGSTNFTYAWNDPSSQSTAIANSLCAGTFKCIVTDDVGCSDSITVTIGGVTPVTFNAQFQKNPSNCSTVNDGEILLNGLTANTSYDISYTDPTGSSIGPTTITTNNLGEYTISTLDSGSYSNFIVDDYICSATVTGPITLTRGSLGILSTPDPATCANPNGMITVEMTPESTPPFNISITGASYSNTYTSTTNNYTEVFNNVISDDYTITVTSGSPGCQVVNNNVFVDGPQQAIIDDVIITQSGCVDQGTITVLSPNTNVNYSIIGTGLSNTTGIFPGIPIGTYTINVSGNNICQSDTMITIYPPVRPLASFNIEPGNVIYNDLTSASVENTSIDADSLVWYLDTIAQTNKTNTLNLSFPIYGEGKTIEICLKAINKTSGCFDPVCQDLIIKERCLLYVPNSFTPNGDGINDRFEASLNCYRKFRMVIFDRWGDIIFESNNPYNGWDGTGKNGIPKANGVYGFRINVINEDNDDPLKTEGSFTLIR